MFRNNSRNSFLQKSCPNLPRCTLDKTLQETFFRYVKQTEKDQQMFMMNEFEKFKESASMGFGEIGLESLVSYSISLKFQLSLQHFSRFSTLQVQSRLKWKSH